MSNLQNAVNQLTKSRDQLSANLRQMGVSAANTETLSSLIPKVLQIEGGGDPLDPPISGDIIFKEDFEGDSYAFAISGNWSIVNVDGKKKLRGITFPDNGMLLVTDELVLPDKYSIGMDITLVGPRNTGTAWSAGIAFAHTNDSNYCHYRLDINPTVTPRYRAQLLQWLSGSATTHATAALEPFDTGEDHTYNLLMTNDSGSTKYYLDGIEIAELARNISTQDGSKFGVRIYNGTFYIDNITVWNGINVPYQ